MKRTAFIASFMIGTIVMSGCNGNKIVKNDMNLSPSELLGIEFTKIDEKDNNIIDELKATEVVEIVNKTYKGQLFNDNLYDNDVIRLTLLNGKNTSSGFINVNKGLIIEPIYYNTISYDKAFTNKYEAVAVDNKWGYIDDEGNKVIDFQYEEARNFSEGYAAVAKNGKFGLINDKNEVIIPFKYFNINESYGNVCELSNGELMGYYFINSKKTIEPKYLNSLNFNSQVTIGYTSPNKFDVVKNDGTILTSLTGEADIINADMSNPELLAKQKKFLISYGGEKRGVLIVENGAILKLIPAEYDAVIYEGNRTILEKHGVNGCDYYLLQDDGSIKSVTENELYGEQQSNYEEDLINGCIVFQNEEGYGFKDSNGKIIVKAKFENLTNFNKKGYAIYTNMDGTSGIINSKGEMVLNGDYQEIYPIDKSTDNGEDRFYALAEDYNQDQISLYDLDKKKIIANGYKDYYLVDSGILVSRDNNSGIIDYDGKFIFPLTAYFDYNDYQKGYLRIKKGDKIQLADLNKKPLSNNSFDNIYELNNRVRIVYDNYSYGITDSEGNIFIPCNYKNKPYVSGNHILFMVEEKDKVNVIIYEIR